MICTSISTPTDPLPHSSDLLPLISVISLYSKDLWPIGHWLEPRLTTSGGVQPLVSYNVGTFETIVVTNRSGQGARREEQSQSLIIDFFLALDEAIITISNLPLVIICRLYLTVLAFSIH